MAVSEAERKRRDDARKAFEENRELVNRANEEAMQRVANSQPTPTQEENDLARLGIIVEEKENDRSGPTEITRTFTANVPVGPHGYETRSVKKS